MHAWFILRRSLRKTKLWPLASLLNHCLHNCYESPPALGSWLVTCLSALYMKNNPDGLLCRCYHILVRIILSCVQMLSHFRVDYTVSFASYHSLGWILLSCVQMILHSKVDIIVLCADAFTFKGGKYCLVCRCYHILGWIMLCFVKQITF